MTFLEAQTEFSSIVGQCKCNLPSSESLELQRRLVALQDRLPGSPEFDAIANAIAEFSPKLTGQIVQAVLDSLNSRDATIREASTLLSHAANKAQADARTLRLEQPKLIAAGLTEAATKISELRAAAKSGNVEKAASNAEALATLIEHLRGTIQVV